MNQFKILTVIAAVLASVNGMAQSKVAEDTLIVEGICGMCKQRIEEAAYGKGVKFVSWENATNQLAIAYRKDKTSLEEIEGRVVAAGHSTENRKADREDYHKLPDCCRYEELHDH